MTHASSLRLTLAAQACTFVMAAASPILVGRIWGADVQGATATALSVAVLASSLGGLGSMDFALLPVSQSATERRHRAVRLLALPLISVLVAGSWFFATGDLREQGFAAALILATSIHLNNVASLTSLATHSQRRYEALRILVPATLFLAVSSAWVLGISTPFPTWSAFLVVVAVVALLVNPRLWVGSVRRPSRSIVRYGLTSAVGATAFLSVVRFDVIMVRKLGGAESAGVYAMALALSEIPQQLPRAASPLLARLAAAEQETPKLKAMTVVTALLAAATAGGSIILEGLLPPEYAQLSEATLILCLAAPALGSLRVLWALEVRSSLRPRLLLMMVTGVGLMAAADAVVVPKWPVLGAAAVSSVVYIGLGLGAFRLRRSHAVRIQRPAPAP